MWRRENKWKKNDNAKKTGAIIKKWELWLSIELKKRSFFEVTLKAETDPKVHGRTKRGKQMKR